MPTKLPFANLWAEFKAFAFKGNMIELAVAVVIGGAFSQVIHAMVTDVINPTIEYAVDGVRAARDTAAKAAATATASVGLTTKPTTAAATEPVAVVTVPPPPAPAAPQADAPAKVVQLGWRFGKYPVGHFVGELINFVILAFAVFLIIVKLLGSMVKRVGGTPEPGEPTTKECPECLSVIPLKAQRCSHCTAVLGPVASEAGGTAAGSGV